MGNSTTPSAPCQRQAGASCLLEHVAGRQHSPGRCLERDARRTKRHNSGRGRWRAVAPSPERKLRPHACWARRGSSTVTGHFRRWITEQGPAGRSRHRRSRAALQAPPLAAQPVLTASARRLGSAVGWNVHRPATQLPASMQQGMEALLVSPVFWYGGLCAAPPVKRCWCVIKTVVTRW